MCSCSSILERTERRFVTGHYQLDISPVELHKTVQQFHNAPPRLNTYTRVYTMRADAGCSSPPPHFAVTNHWIVQEPCPCACACQMSACWMSGC